MKTKTAVRSGYIEANVCSVFSSGGLFILKEISSDTSVIFRLYTELVLFNRKIESKM